MPFEVYVDYIGSYTYDLDSGALDMDGQALNYLPYDFDGEGAAEIDDEGRLTLRDIWLGTPPTDYYGAIYCGHRFVRVR